MLTIQPNFTTHPVRKIAFKGEGAYAYDDSMFENKAKYYEDKTKEFDAIINNEKTHPLTKKVIKGFKVISSALWEGWLVAWGAKKGAEVLKSSVISGVGARFVRNAKKVTAPLGKPLRTIGSIISDEAAKYIKRLKASNFMQETSLGKTLTKGLNLLGKGIKYIGTQVSNLFAPLKKAKADEIYDKTAKTASTILGVGAGAAGGYNAAVNSDKRINNVDLQAELDQEDNYDNLHSLEDDE